MSEYEVGHLIYLLVLGGFLVLWFLASNRNGLGKTMQHAVIWMFIFFATVAAVSLWEDIGGMSARQGYHSEEDGTVTVRRSPNGHFHLNVLVNNVPIEFVVDTGATGIVLSREDAERAGFQPDKLPYIHRARTANGTVSTAPVLIGSMQVGNIIDHAVPARVNGGELFGSLLGMTYLDRFSRVEIRRDTLTLER